MADNWLWLGSLKLAASMASEGMVIAVQAPGTEAPRSYQPLELMTMYTTSSITGTSINVDGGASPY